MHVTIREDGSIDPPEAAYLLMTEYFQQRSGDVERDPTFRTFVCPECGHNFEAVAGKVTMHDCGVNHKDWRAPDESN